MILKPCLRCPHKADCGIRDAMRLKLRGTGITSASFICERRLLGLDPGVRVEVELNDQNGEYNDGGPILEMAWLPGTIIGLSYKHQTKATGRLLVYMDDVTYREKRVVAVPPDACRLLDEPRVPVCRADLFCGRPLAAERAEHCDDGRHAEARPGDVVAIPYSTGWVDDELRGAR